MPRMEREPRRVVGVMTGTSMDGIDAALAELHGRGLSVRARLLAHRSSALGDLGPRLRGAAAGEPKPAEWFAALALDLGRRCAEAAASVIEPGPGPALIAVHGQTILHRPPLSWQILNPAPIAARFGCPVVFDLRQADLAAGGQGAPITPIADWVLFRAPRAVRAVVNLGGFCNVTIVAPHLDDVRGFDVCACNHVLDAVARRALERPFDEGGAAAARGRADAQASESLHALLERQRRAGRSLGTGDGAAAWVAGNAGRLAPDDLAASAVEGIGRCIGEALHAHPAKEIFVAGGGALNAALVGAIGRLARLPVRASSDLGVPVQAREALAMAVLGALCADGVPITLAQAAGCGERAPLAGAWAGGFPFSATRGRVRRIPSQLSPASRADPRP